jgi:Tol biopolymer transport system component
MVIDGKEQPGNGLQSLSFSPDGKRKAVIQKRGDKFIARIDGVDGKEVDGTEYDRIEEPGVHFSHDGLHTAYLAQARGEKFVVVDGVEGQHFKRLGTTALAFVPNGSRVMYAVRRGEKRESLVIGDAEGPVVEVDEEHSVPYRALTFSPDGSRYAYAAHLEKDKEIAVIDGELFGPGGKQAPDKLRTYTKLAKRTPFFSPDGRRVGFVAEREDGWVAVVDGVESPLYSIVQRTAMDFSPDGQHIAFVAGRQGKKMIVVDGFELDHGWDGFLPKSDIVWDGSKRFSIRASRNPKYMLVEVELP